MNENEYAPTLAMFNESIAEVTRLKVELANAQADARSAQQSFARLYDNLKATVEEMIDGDDTETLRNVPGIIEICKELDVPLTTRLEFEITVIAQIAMDVPRGTNVSADSFNVTDFCLDHDDLEIEITETAKVHSIDEL